ncbi:unnamed protein product [Merluccius merluccius]
MPEVEHLRLPSREERPNQQDQGDLQAVCSGRHRSCALVNTPSPCVNKAIYHIQELKRKVEICEPWSPLRKETTDVLVEVVYLLERLEADRQDAEDCLLKEKRRSKVLGKRLGSVSLWKQQEHAALVQKEHEACTRDISELKRTLRLRRELVERLQEKLVGLEVVNKRLHEDISSVQKQGPLVREKIDLETQLAEELTAAQNQKLEGDAEVTRLEGALQSKRNDLAALSEENLGLQLEADDLKRKTSESEKAVRQMLKDKKQMLQRIGEKEEQRDAAEGEAAQAAARHAATKARLEEQERITAGEEQNARSQCAMITEELQREQWSSELANQKLHQEHEEAASATRELETHVEELRRLDHERSQKITILRERLRDTQRKHQDTSAKLEKEKNLKVDQLNAMKEDLKAALRENTKLAQEYGDLQQTLLSARQEAACVLAQRNRAEQSFHFHTQERMHEAMVKYFIQRSLYSHAELDRCQLLSRETDRRVGAAQGAGQTDYENAEKSPFGTECNDLVRCIFCKVEKVGIFN